MDICPHCGESLAEAFAQEETEQQKQWGVEQRKREQLEQEAQVKYKALLAEEHSKLSWLEKYLLSREIRFLFPCLTPLRFMLLDMAVLLLFILVIPLYVTSNLMLLSIDDMNAPTIMGMGMLGLFSYVLVLYPPKIRKGAEEKALQILKSSYPEESEIIFPEGIGKLGLTRSDQRWVYIK